MSVLAIDIVADIICPWCFIGTRRLNQALAVEPARQARVEYHPYLLDASVPPEGQDLRERLRAKYGADPEQMFARVEAAARESGIPLDFSKIRRTPSTIPGHTLLRHAAGRGTQRALAEALYEAYFLNGLDISDHGVLAELGSAHGFTRQDVHDLLSDASERAATIEEASAATRAGIRGVPFFVFGGRVTVSGAQSPETLRAAMEQAAAARAVV